MAKKFLAAVLGAAVLGVMLFTAPVRAGIMAPTISIKFGADDPPGVGSMLAATDLAGVGGPGLPDVRTMHWNNASGASGTIGLLQRDDFGIATTTGTSVTWSSANTWSSTGRGEENNNFPAGSPDRRLVSGYLDDSPGNPTTVTLKNLPPDFGRYDVYLYFLGGVAGRFGDYTVDGLTVHNVAVGGTGFNGPAYVQAIGDNSTGNFLLFHDLSGSEIDISTVPNSTGFRSPINAVEIVQLPPLPPPPIVPEPTSLALVGVGLAGLLAYGWRRRTRA